MERSISTQAIVIRRERFGEYHKSLSLLTEDLGLINATAYGAYKMQSRLRLGSEPFTWSLAHLYHNPVKRSYKVTEMDIRASFEGLPRDLSRLAAASLWAEVVQKSLGAGDVSGRLFRLLRDSLLMLEAAEARREPYVTLQFLWRFLALAGYEPRIDACDSCGAGFGEQKPAFYAARFNAFLCPSCRLPSDPRLPPGSLRYLEATREQPVARAVEVVLEEESLRALRDTLPLIVQSVLEGTLASLRWVRSGG